MSDKKLDLNDDSHVGNVDITKNDIDLFDDTHKENPDMAAKKLELIELIQGEMVNHEGGTDNFRELVSNTALHAIGFHWRRRFHFKDLGAITGENTLKWRTKDIQDSIFDTMDQVERGEISERAARHELFQDIASLLNFKFESETGDLEFAD